MLNITYISIRYKIKTKTDFFYEEYGKRFQDSLLRRVYNLLINTAVSFWLLWLIFTWKSPLYRYLLLSLLFFFFRSWIATCLIIWGFFTPLVSSLFIYERFKHDGCYWRTFCNLVFLCFKRYELWCGFLIDADLQ